MEFTREIIQYRTEEEWLDARSKDLTSTEVAALFGCSPYCTEFELFHRKTGALAPDFEENIRMKWGNRLEGAIAAGIAEDLGLIVEPFKTYMRIPELRLGSSFDFRIIGLADGFSGDEDARNMFREFGPGVMEVKAVDSLQFKRTWLDGGDEIEAPPHIEFQVQHQLEVANLGWTVIAPLIGGNTPKPVIRLRDREIGAMIREKAAQFWSRVDRNLAPTPDFTKDGATIGKLYVENDGSSIDLTDDPRVFALCKTYKDAAAEAKDAETRKQAAKAELLTIIEAHKSVTAGGFKISAGTRRESFRAYHRESNQRVTITLSTIPAADIEAEVPAYRDFRLSGS